MKKHAYLIMAHNNFYCLEKLLMLLDDPRNNIFLHIDAKVKDFNFAKFKEVCQQANVIYPKKRVNVRWGTQSQVKTEMLLLKTASKYCPHHYYHIISGSDLPLRSQNYIHEWFKEKTHNYLFFTNTPNQWDVQRISRYHISFNSKNIFFRKFISIFNTTQELLQINRIRNAGIFVQKGSNWASLTQQAVNVLLANEPLIMKLTRLSSCADEIYKQTILLQNQVPVICDDLRMILWENGNHPRTYTTSDYTFLCNSDKLFARKFSDSLDRDIIDLISNKVMGDC